MQASCYQKCRICGKVCNLKYQMGYSKKHPIRYKCSCGVTIRGEFQDGDGITFDNADEIYEQVMPDFVVHSSGEFLTLPPYAVESFEETLLPTSFILATQMMDYENFQIEFSNIINYRDNYHLLVRAINELYDAHNTNLLISTIRRDFDAGADPLPLNNEADILRAIFIINQMQFVHHGEKNHTEKTADLFRIITDEHAQEEANFIAFLSQLNRINEWKQGINAICGQVYDKIDLLIPVIGIDFYKEDREAMLSGKFAITTTSFEDIKQLYIDLYELICNLAILAIGFDNIILRNDYKAVRQIQGLNVKTLDDVSKMRNKGNIIKLIDTNAPYEALICKCLDSDIRNSIGHFSYYSEEIISSHGQTIRFYDFNNRSKYTDQTLIQICYDIWQMYKCLGIFSELIYYIEMRLLAKRGIFPTPVMIRAGRASTKKKIYPNESCPCGSGKKYKKCCGAFKKI